MCHTNLNIHRKAQQNQSVRDDESIFGLNSHTCNKAVAFWFTQADSSRGVGFSLPFDCFLIIYPLTE